MYPHFDIQSFILYILIGFICMLFTKYYLIRPNKISFLYWATAVLVIFAISRVVAPSIGGQDALNYEQIFIEYSNNTFDFYSIEFLFWSFTGMIRLITDEPIFYRLICYTIIASSYFIFIKNFCPHYASPIPYFALIIPYLMSFNTMRSSIAASVILLGLVLFKKKELFWSLFICISSVFIHRMSIIFIPFFIFYYITRDERIYRAHWLFLSYIIFFSLIGYILSIIFKTYLLSSSIIEGADASYLTINTNASILNASSYLLPLVLLLIFMLFFSVKKDQNSLLKSIVIYDILVFPTSFFLGMWRANEYFYVARLTMWAIIIYDIRVKFKPNVRLIIDIVFFLSFFIWVISRINATWEDSALMPYILNWF